MAQDLGKSAVITGGAALTGPVAATGPSLLGFFGDLARCETRLGNALDEALRSAHGIVTSQFEFLRYIRDHTRPRVADLAAEFAVGAGAVSKSVDRLEKRGLVVRQPNPDDRRSAILALTGEGRALADAAERTVTARLGQLVTPHELTVSGRVLGALRAALERGGVGTPAG